MSEILHIDPRLGDFVVRMIEQETGHPVEIILIAFPLVEMNEGATATIGTPVFVTSMSPDDMPSVLTHVAEYIRNAGPPEIVAQREM